LRFVKVKVKVNTSHAIVGTERSTVMLLLFLSLGARWDEWSRPCPAHFTPPRNHGLYSSASIISSLSKWNLTTHSAAEIMDHWFSHADRAKPKHSEVTTSECHFVHHKSYKEWSGI